VVFPVDFKKGQPWPTDGSPWDADAVFRGLARRSCCATEHSIYGGGDGRRVYYAEIASGGCRFRAGDP